MDRLLANLQNWFDSILYELRNLAVFFSNFVGPMQPSNLRGRYLLMKSLFEPI